MEKLESLIKTYYDFPKKGIAFKDILGIIQDPEVFRELIFKMSSNHVIKNSEAIIAVDARGFIFGSAILYNFAKKELLPLEDRGAYLVIGFTDEGSSFQYTQKRAEDVEQRLIPLLKTEDSPYNRFLMIVPGFGSDNSF